MWHSHEAQRLYVDGVGVLQSFQHEGCCGDGLKAVRLRFAASYALASEHSDIVRLGQVMDYDFQDGTVITGLKQDRITSHVKAAYI